MNSQEAREYLNGVYPAHKAEIYTNNILHNDLDLSIIIPVYNQEKYIEECLDSVLTQKTKYKFETIVINDGSTDHSGELLEKYKDQVVLRTQENRGFSGARNRGLSDLRGRYLMFVDSDDVLLPDAIEALMNTAYESNADIVEGSSDALRSVRGGWQREPNFRREDNCTDCGIGVLSGVPWAKVWRSSIWQNYKLPEGFWFEDTFPYMVIYPKKYKIYTIPDIVYGYRINTNGITVTSAGNKKCIDSLWITESLLEYQRKEKLINLSTKKQFINQTLMNFGRVTRLPLKILEAEFEISVKLYREYFESLPEVKGLNRKQKFLEDCIKQDNWLLYSIPIKAKRAAKKILKR